MLKMHLFKTLRIFIIIPIIFSCSQKKNQNQQTSETVVVDGYVAEYESFSDVIYSTGDLLPFEEVEIKTPVSGNVVRINFMEGQFVQKGFLIVEIDNRSWTAQKSGLEARLKTAENEYERKTDLHKIGGVSLEEVEKSEAEMDDLKAKIRELEVMIDLAHIRAPFSGRLGMRNFSPGAYLTQGQMVVRLVQTDKLRVNFTIPAKYATQAEIDQEVKVISSGSLDTSLAFVYAVDPMIRPTSRTVQVRALIDNKDDKLIPGNFVQIMLKVDQLENAILVPAESVIPEQNTQAVFVVRQGKAQKVQVEAGARTSNRVQINNGIMPGDTVIISGLMGIRDGDQIEVKTMIEGGGQ